MKCAPPGAAFLQHNHTFKPGSCTACTAADKCLYGEERHQVECKSWYKLEGPACFTVRVTAPMSSATRSATKQATATQSTVVEKSESAEASAHATAQKEVTAT